MGCITSRDDGRVGVADRSSSPVNAPACGNFEGSRTEDAVIATWAPPDELPHINKLAEAEEYLDFLPEALAQHPETPEKRRVQTMMSGLLAELKCDTPDHDAIAMWVDELCPEVLRLRQLEEDRKMFAGLEQPMKPPPRRKIKKAF